MFKNDSERAHKVKTGIGWGVLALFILIIVFKCFYTVNEQHNAVVTQFGRVVKVNTAGFYFKAPWQSVHKVDVTTHGTGIGYIVSPTGQNITDNDNGIMITADFNLLNIDFYLEYRVTDPIAYLYNSEEPEQILSNIALANIRTGVSNYKVDEAMIQALEMYNIGLSVVNITVQDSAPPTEEISAAFKAVETAKQKADTAMNEALQYQNQKIPEAEANADAIIRKASAYKEARIAEATGQVERFLKMYEEYKKYPLITKRRLFFERMEEILPGLKVIITSGDTQTVLPLDSFINFNTVNNNTTNSYDNNTSDSDDWDEE